MPKKEREPGVLERKLLDQDGFASGFGFKLPGGNDRLPTYLGSFSSIAVLLILIFYGALQMSRLVSFCETVVTMSVRDSFFSPEEVYPYDVEDLTYDGFDLAFGLTAYDDNPDRIDDPRYGQLRARYVRWGFPGQTERYKDLTSHPCTEEEKGVDNRDGNPRFYPIHPNSLNDTRFYGGKLDCLDDKIELQGDYNSYKTSALQIVFEKCNNATISPRDSCYSEQNITDFLRRKFIIVYQNQIRFNAQQYDD